MTSAQARAVLIAGGGWRVSRFVVPALLNEGVAMDRLVIFRRSAGASNAETLRGIRVVTNLDDVGRLDCQLILNCVSAESMVSVQRELIGRFPAATHMCDTPIFSSNQDLGRVLTLSRARLFSLEDWPHMPNLVFFADRVKRLEGNAFLTFEHFGITGHFLSLYRSIRHGWSPFSSPLTGSGSAIAGRPRSGLVMSWQGPKQFARAKIGLRSPSTLVEDFHEVEPRPHDDDEVLYRVVSDDSVKYCCGRTEVSAHPVRPDLLAAFEPLADRKNVHELDKFIGLTSIFRSTFRQGSRPAYSYLSSARDAITARRLERRQVSRLW